MYQQPVGHGRWLFLTSKRNIILHNLVLTNNLALQNDFKMLETRKVACISPPFVWILTYVL